MRRCRQAMSQCGHSLLAPGKWAKHLVVQDLQALAVLHGEEADV